MSQYWEWMGPLKWSMHSWGRCGNLQRDSLQRLIVRLSWESMQRLFICTTWKVAREQWILTTGHTTRITKSRGVLDVWNSLWYTVSMLFVLRLFRSFGGTSLLTVNELTTMFVTPFLLLRYLCSPSRAYLYLWSVYARRVLINVRFMRRSSQNGLQRRAFVQNDLWILEAINVRRLSEINDVRVCLCDSVASSIGIHQVVDQVKNRCNLSFLAVSSCAWIAVCDTAGGTSGNFHKNWDNHIAAPFCTPFVLLAFEMLRESLERRLDRIHQIYGICAKLAIVMLSCQFVLQLRHQSVECI